MINEIIKKCKGLECGVNIAFGSDIPVGAGLSSSAAIASGVGHAIRELFNLKLDNLDLAKAAQDTEKIQIGLQCGIMDMYASIFARKDTLIKLDCRHNSHEYLPFEAEDFALILINSKVKHNLSSSGYNVRVQESSECINAIREIYNGVVGYRDVSEEMLLSIKNKLPLSIFNRGLYIIQEMKRVEKMKVALLNKDFDEVITLINGTHNGLSRLYEVSCIELDFLADFAQTFNSSIGSRMHGGGFGGCTINFLPKVIVADFVQEVKAAYKNRFNLECTAISFDLSDGVSTI
jgi:galactokinase